jgi:hypothetical protein
VINPHRPSDDRSNDVSDPVHHAEAASAFLQKNSPVRLDLGQQLFDQGD